MDDTRVELRGDGGLPLVASAYGDPAGHPVLLLHGGGQTRHAWGGTCEALARAGFYALSLDLRGHGDSAWAPDGCYDLSRFAADMRAVVPHFRSPPAAVGASLGGLTALLAEGESDGPLLSALVLVDVAPRMEPRGVARIVSFMAAHTEGFDSIEAAADAIAAFLPHRPRPTDLSGLAKNLRRRDDGRWYWHWDPRFIHREARDPSFSYERLSAAARALAIPTLLVRGQLSDVIGQDEVDDFRRLAPHAEYVDVASAAHMVAGDRNDAFAGAVIDFLGRVSSRRTEPSSRDISRTSGS